jgi:hypothetical protein
MVRRLKTTRSGAYRFPRYLEDQDFYCYFTDSDEHQEASEKGGEVNSASGQASPPTVIELSDDEPEEEPAEEQEQEEELAEEQEQGGDPDDHPDPEDSDPEDGDADDQPAPEKWDVVICHHDGGHARFPSKLRRLFQRLQLHVTIDYVGLRRTHPRYPTQWDVSVHILEDNPQDGGLYEVVVHQALATRATFAAGRDDAARRALSAWFYEEAHHLTNSVWGDFPHRRSGAVGSEIPMANETLGARYAMQVGLVAALNTNLDDTIMELQDLRDQQDEDQREIKRLKAVIAGQDEEEVQGDGENWPAMSPRPARTSYGSLGSRTRIIWP